MTIAASEKPRTIKELIDGLQEGTSYITTADDLNMMCEILSTGATSDQVQAIFEPENERALRRIANLFTFSTGFSSPVFNEFDLFCRFAQEIFNKVTAHQAFILLTHSWCNKISEKFVQVPALTRLLDQKLCGDDTIETLPFFSPAAQKETTGTHPTLLFAAHTAIAVDFLLKQISDPATRLEYLNIVNEVGQTADSYVPPAAHARIHHHRAQLKQLLRQGPVQIFSGGQVSESMLLTPDAPAHMNGAIIGPNGFLTKAR